MRCSRCGNDNPGDNRFCGMCGATLLAPPPPAPVKVPETATQRAASGGAEIPAAPVVTAARPPEPPPRPVEPPREPAPAHYDSPVISGPSFLGLNDPPPRKRASLSADSHHDSSSGNLDYLLDDEEEHHHGRSAGMYILILIALALAVGFGYLRWKKGGFAWLNPSANKPAATQTPNAPDTNAPAGETACSNKYSRRAESREYSGDHARRTIAVERKCCGSSADEFCACRQPRSGKQRGQHSSVESSGKQYRATRRQAQRLWQIRRKQSEELN